MRNYIILNGKNSNEINGLLIQELPPISKPQIRTETEEIDGRDGDIVTKLGFAAYDKEISVGLYKDFDINEIIAYFNSEGTIVFSNEPDKYYNYQIIDQIDFERLVRYRTATIRMHCQPFKYSTTQGTITKDASATVSDEGSNLVLENTAEAPFKRLDPKGNSTQQTYSGKNLFDRANAKENTVLKWADGGDNAESKSIVGDYIAASEGQQFSSNFSMIIFCFDASKAYLGTIQSNQTTIAKLAGRIAQTMTIPSGYGVNYIRIEYRTGSNQSLDMTQQDIMVNLGSTVEPYEEYCGGIPSPNPSFPQSVQTVSGAQTVKITGKNLWGGLPTTYSTTSSGVDFTTYPDGSVSARGTSTAVAGSCNLSDARRYGLIIEIPAGTYTISGSNANLPLQLFDGDGTILASSATPTFTVAKTTEIFIRVRLASGTTVDGTNYIQLERNNQSTDYEPHQSQSQEINLGTLELAKIGNYQDYIYKSGEKWYKHAEVGKATVSLGTTVYTLTSGLKGSTYTPSGKIAQQDAGAYCDRASNSSSSSASVRWSGSFYENAGNFMFIGTSTDDSASLKAKYDGATLYFILATPVDEEITDATLIEQLEALAEAHSYKGRTHINATATGNNAPHIIAAEVGVDNESTVTNSGNINSKPVIKIYGSGNIGAYLNDIQILQIALGDEGYITIDTNLMEAYKDTLDNLKNRLVTGDYSKFSLKPGANKIYFSGTVTKYEISKYSRWL